MRRTDTAPRRRRPAVKIETAPGAYATVPVWQTREAFLASVEEAGAAFRSDRRRSLRAVAEALAGYAEHRTGRDVAVSVERLARVAGVVARTVYRRLADLRDAGLLVTVDGGRHLTRAERERTGRFRKASTRALTHAPREVSPHPETEGLTGNLTSPSITNARTRAAKKTTSNSKTDRKPRTLRVQRLAAAVDRRLPYLTRGRHVGNLANVLQAVGVEEWSASDVVGAVDAWHAQNGRATLATAARDSLAWFAWALREARGSGQESRTAAARAAQEAVRLRAAERAAQHAEEDARAAALDAPEVAGARLSIRETLAAAKAARTYAATA
ncbi:hypothetical protein [Cellulosimicrobium cellulans]|uniref:Helix-turn-helix domain-containing protein n=1 Tax=Cellulosimicrobium cellulans TaxID=1710 RepID=A0A4Y4DZE1_CELCE|nr:hypothetical protein [Cellulosimicrobium cellulans]GED09174.1 hypothetical protein CCE02nite_11730 [Cellulosimicrobium cellulans]